MSAIRSASSTTTISTCDRSTEPRSTRSVEPSGTGDEHVDAVSQGRKLLGVPDAAVDRRHASADRRGERCHDLFDLGRELTRRDQDQRRRVSTTSACGVPLGRQPRQDRQPEGQGLAGPGGSLAAHVAPGEAVGQGSGLDREKGW